MGGCVWGDSCVCDCVWVMCVCSGGDSCVCLGMCVWVNVDVCFWGMCGWVCMG